MSLPPIADQGVIESFVRCADRSRIAALRSMSQFAEEEIWINTGPRPGRYQLERQPFARLWFREVESGGYARYMFTGPTQMGKTVQGLVVPAMYHLFELEETVIVGLPNMKLAEVKWRTDFRPMIMASKYRDLVPSEGTGSKGGTGFGLIEFRNGARLHFMSAGGNDVNRASITSRVLLLTELDKMDDEREASDEADPVTQMEGRTDAFPTTKRIFGECTVSTQSGRIWNEVTRRGVNGRMALPCHACGEYVCPEPEHIVGWEEAGSIVEAGLIARLICPACSSVWSEAQRQEANRRAVLVCDGQTVDRDGQVHGERRATDTFSMRVWAVNNMFTPIGAIAQRAWEAERAENREVARRAVYQYQYALPPPEEDTAVTKLSVEGITRRQGMFTRRVLPPGTLFLTMGVDVGKWRLHWVVMAWTETHGFVVDYGVKLTSAGELGEQAGIYAALQELGDDALEGINGVPITQVWIDSGNWTAVVYEWIKASPDPRVFRPTKGWGARQYAAPHALNREVKHIGVGYHFSWLKDSDVVLVHLSVDEWKGSAHRALSEPLSARGAVVLWACEPKEHRTFAKHLTAEHAEDVFVPGTTGLVRKWIVDERENHWLDAYTLASAAGHYMGFRVVGSEPPPDQPAETPRPPVSTSRPFLVTQRRV